MSGDYLRSMTITFLANEILDESDSDNIVIIIQNGEPRKPMFNRHINGLRQRVCLRNCHHIWQWHHDFSSNGVSKLDDRLNEIAFFFFDHIIVHCRFNNSEKFLFADKRALFETFAFHDDIGQTNQPT